MATWSIVQADCLEWLAILPADSVDLVIGSPPYEAQRTYGIGFDLKGQAWVDWMVKVFQASERVCKGLVCMVVEGFTKNYKWSATPALLMADLHRAGMNLRKPPAFHRVGIPGSGGPDWLRNDYEFIVCTTRAGKLPWSDNTAAGKPPKWQPGGDMSYRNTEGKRKNAVAKLTARNGDLVSRKKLGCHPIQRSNAKRSPAKQRNQESDCYVPPDIANPGNVIKCVIGGGQMGSDLAHENEAPYPQKLAEFFVASFCPPKVCTACGTAVEWKHENTTVQAVQTEVYDLRVSERPEQVLQQEMRESCDGERSGELSMVRGADNSDAAQSGSKVLLESVREPMVGEEQNNDPLQDHDRDGLHNAVPSRSPKRGRKRICDGASASDGKGSRQTAPEKRDSASQEQGSVGQSSAEFGGDDQATTRLVAKRPTETNQMSELRPSNSKAKAACKKCGADLSQPGAIRPGIVCDPFSGSGTTAAAAISLGRNFMGCDIRESQVALTKRRLEGVTPTMFA